MEGRADRVTALVALLLLLYGLVMVYSATAPFSLRYFHSDTYLFLKQLAAAGIGIVLLVGFSRFNYHRLCHLDDIFLLGSFLLTVMTVLPLPGISNGRWLHLGPFDFQPTELLKFSLIIYLAATIERKRDCMGSFANGVLPFIIVLLVLAGVVMNQPDFGMTLLLAALTIVMLFLGGARVSHLVALVAGSLPFIYLAVKLAPYRLGRIVSFINPQAYNTSSGYQIIQSMVAIGSGGLVGRGLGASRAKLFYLPQAHNDFIFSITAEELGLLGAVVLLGLFAVFIWRAFIIAARAPDRLGALLALGIGFTLCLQTLLNLGVALGVLPVTGLTLPFISNGGSSLLVTLAMVGVLLNISKQGGQQCEF
ncbi:MAG TPA: putative lipid II flippase FtsW [Candidatus Heimdallarchaeota archaeon]|nr:putative lipid II flippase FtsW [Candidatus Heimdallarchaeota archaeon]